VQVTDQRWSVAEVHEAAIIVAIAAAVIAVAAIPRVAAIVAVVVVTAIVDAEHFHDAADEFEHK
jgi:hypothetical protein